MTVASELRAPSLGPQLGTYKDLDFITPALHRQDIAY